ncbi:hypothetical protein [Rhizobium phaseoli]|uniref:hypothetical protein n=1 Tax=Rhizobium phaseoli TaxID=396 RepID=UPI00111265C0|nr:hypothetical protein [Rhizobium phaseoli]
MTDPEHILKSLLDAMKKRVQEQERELDVFRKAAEDHQRKAEEFIAGRNAEIARTRKSIEVFQSELAAMHDARTIVPSAVLLIPTTLENAPADNASESERIRDAARRILREAGRPLMQREIKAKMDEMGVVIQSADPVELIRAALRRHVDEFQHVKGQGYTLTNPKD